MKLEVEIPEEVLASALAERIFQSMWQKGAKESLDVLRRIFGRDKLDMSLYEMIKAKVFQEVRVAVQRYVNSDEFKEEIRRDVRRTIDQLVEDIMREEIEDALRERFAD